MDNIHRTYQDMISGQTQGTGTGQNVSYGSLGTSALPQSGYSLVGQKTRRPQTNHSHTQSVCLSLGTTTAYSGVIRSLSTEQHPIDHTLVISFTQACTQCVFVLCVCIGYEINNPAKIPNVRVVKLYTPAPHSCEAHCGKCKIPV